VTVFGANFDAAESLRCRFGAETSTATYLTPTAVRCAAPRSIIPRPDFETPPHKCTGYFFQGVRRHLCVPSDLNCGWQPLDGSTAALVCARFAMRGAVVVNSSLPYTFETPLGDNLHPDLPLRRRVAVEVSVDGQHFSSSGVLFTYYGGFAPSE
jgi:hypothetical protein